MGRVKGSFFCAGNLPFPPGKHWNVFGLLCSHLFLQHGIERYPDLSGSQGHYPGEGSLRPERKWLGSLFDRFPKYSSISPPLQLQLLLLSSKTLDTISTDLDKIQPTRAKNCQTSATGKLEMHCLHISV